MSLATPPPQAVVLVGGVGSGFAAVVGGDHAGIVVKCCEKRDGGWFQGVVRCPALLRLFERVYLLW